MLFFFFCGYSLRTHCKRLDFALSRKSGLVYYDKCAVVVNSKYNYRIARDFFCFASLFFAWIYGRTLCLVIMVAMHSPLSPPCKHRTSFPKPNKNQSSIKNARALDANTVVATQPQPPPRPPKPAKSDNSVCLCPTAQCRNAILCESERNADLFF